MSLQLAQMEYRTQYRLLPLELQHALGACEVTDHPGDRAVYLEMYTQTIADGSYPHKDKWLSLSADFTTQPADPEIYLRHLDKLANAAKKGPRTWLEQQVLGTNPRRGQTPVQHTGHAD